MYITRRQRARINKVLKPFYLTSNYLETGLQSLVKFYAKYFAERRYPIRYFLPKFSSYRETYRLTILFNAYNRKYGYAKRRRPETWLFYGDKLLTKYGHKKKRIELKRKRRRRRKLREKQFLRRNRAAQKSAVVHNLSIESHKNDTNKDNIIILESSSSSNCIEQNPIEENAQQIKISAPNYNENIDAVTIELPKESHSDANVNTRDDEFGDEPVDNIWNLDIQEVAALITENGNDENQLTEGMKP